MKCNVFLTIIAILLAVLIGYGFYAANKTETYVLLLTVGSGLLSALTLVGSMGISTIGRTGGANIKVLSGIFFILFIISNLVFAFTAIKIAPYIIVNGMLGLIYATIVYKIIKTGE